MIDLRDFQGIGRFAQVRANATQVGADTVIERTLAMLLKLRMIRGEKAGYGDG